MSNRSFLSRARGLYCRRAASLVFKRLIKVRNLRQSLISFTFDDFPRSALKAGGSILNQYGFTGTYYVSFGLQGVQQPSGEMFLPEDIETVFKKGHELGCHTFSHCHSWDSDAAAFEDSVIRNRVALRQLFPEAEFKTFSYPISPPRPLTKARVAKHFLCSRGGGQTFNAGLADLNQLSAFFLEKSRDNIQAVKNLIDLNQQSRGWLIFATHDVSQTPTPYGCTPEFFQEVVQYAAQSGAAIVHVVKALEILNQIPTTERG
jgi:peptidoglycan/xylan/chitin deacetylase (PgdA/CDA1 family)